MQIECFHLACLLVGHEFLKQAIYELLKIDIDARWYSVYGSELYYSHMAMQA